MFDKYASMFIRYQLSPNNPLLSWGNISSTQYLNLVSRVLTQTILPLYDVKMTPPNLN